MKLRLHLLMVLSILGACPLTVLIGACDSSVPGVSRVATVSVLISTRDATPLEPGFAGYNVALMSVPLRYADPRLAAAARRLSPGWLRYPAGTRSDAFDWTNGRSHQSWVDRASQGFAPADRPFFHDVLQKTLVALDAKGGEPVRDASALADAVGAEGLIICVNVYTDTPESAGRFAAYVKDRHLRVLAWELGNEPYFSPGLFPTATAYATAVRPFADAIHRVEPAATVVVALSDAGFQDRNWDDALAAFKPRYWNALVYHHYPRIGGAPDSMMAALNTVLLNSTTAYLIREVRSRFGSMPVMITEAGPQDGPEPGMSGTLYGGIWSAEYALRLSSISQMKHFGLHQLIGAAGIAVTTSHTDSVDQAPRAGLAAKVATPSVMLYESAQGVAYATAASIINSAIAAYETRVRGGGNAPLSGGDSMPAIYAQAFQRRAGDALVVSNKGARNEVLEIVLDGHALLSPLQVATVSSPAPSATNTFGRERITRVASTASRQVTIPAYSVVQIVW